MEEMLPNIPRVYTALAEWSACMLYILLYRRRIRGVRFWGTVGVGFLFMAAFLINNRSASAADVDDLYGGCGGDDVPDVFDVQRAVLHCCRILYSARVYSCGACGIIGMADLSYYFL